MHFNLRLSCGRECAEIAALRRIDRSLENRRFLRSRCDLTTFLTIMSRFIATDGR